MDELIYLDYNATTPIDPEVAAAMKPFLEVYFGNPSSSHRFGVEARIAVEQARGSVAALLHCKSEEVIFTSGGSESNNFAIKGAAMANRERGRHIITSSIEHPAVTEVCHYLEQQGFEVSYLPVDEQGFLHPETLKQALRDDTILVSVMHANNEVGSIQPIRELADLAHERGALFHCDAAQSVGKIPTRVDELGVDLMSVAAHKFYGPKGIGALYIRTGVKLEKLIHGADHERNFRAGTENILEIAGLGKAAEIALRDLDKNMKHYARMRDLLQNKLKEGLPGIRINAEKTARLPNTLSVSVSKIEANTLLDELEGIAASAGAACHTDNIDVSAVLEAMMVPLDYAMGTIRFSTGRSTSPEDIEKAAELFISKVQTLRGDEGSNETAGNISPVNEIKLTHFTHGLGCACKLRPQDLEQVLKKMPKPEGKNILVGLESSDDAAVYRIDDDKALVQTLDFFTPIVDEPYYFGAIAAANALSDIYAMGARPLFALNIVGFPDKRLPLTVLEEILRGAHDKAKEANIPILGGHTVEDTEPKYGMVVSGIISPDKILKNTGAHAGDQLYLSKPLGTGIIATATKRGAADEATRQQAIELMATLNKDAARLAIKHQARACTDVTGFGLLGHLLEMVRNTDTGVEIYFDSIPFLPEARNFALAGIIPGGTLNNKAWVEKEVVYAPQLSEIDRILLNDAQTSGGLLIAIPWEKAGQIEQTARENKLFLTNIGRFTKEMAGKIVVK